MNVITNIIIRFGSILSYHEEKLKFPPHSRPLHFQSIQVLSSEYTRSNDGIISVQLNDRVPLQSRGTFHTTSQQAGLFFFISLNASNERLESLERNSRTVADLWRNESG